jgi:hypothetical protein
MPADLRETIARSLSGLTHDEAENILALSLVTRRQLDPALIAAQKTQIIRKSDVLEMVSATHRLEDVGGHDHLKAWLREAQLSFSDRARAYGIEPVRATCSPASHPGILSGASAADLHRPQDQIARVDLTMTLRSCRLMVSRMHLAETDGAVWLFPASSGAATLVGVIHLTQPSRTYTSGGHVLATIFARVVWSLASELTGFASGAAVLFPWGSRRILEVADVTGDALRLPYDGSGATLVEAPTSVARVESIAAALLARAQRIAGASLN